MKEVVYREVVLVEDLAPLVKATLDKRQRVYEAELDNRNGSPVGPLRELSERSKVPERRIYGILRGETVAVDLDVADRLLLACGMFVELEIPEAIWPAQLVNKLVLEQTEFIPTFAKTRGIAVPKPGTKARLAFTGQMRMLAHKEQRREGAAA